MSIDWTTDVERADWWVERLHPFGTDVGSVVPDCFEAYARIFHPDDEEGRRLTWAEVAAVHGRVAHPDMQWAAITARPGEAHIEFPSAGPSVGCLPSDLLEELVHVLTPFTSSPHVCYVAVWDGYAQLGHPGATLTARWDTGGAGATGRPGRDETLTPIVRPVREWPRVSAPAREYLLAQGPLHDILPFSDRLGGQSPNVWWPKDRAWIVVTEIDFAWTYVGADRRTIDAVLAHTALEALETVPTARHTSDGDTVNR